MSAFEPRPAPLQSFGHGSDASSRPVSRPLIPQHRLTLKEVLDALLADGLVDGAEIERAGIGARADRGELHPLVVIANKQLRQAQPPHQALSIEGLTEWLAGKAGLPYLRIDPLKFDIAAVERLLPFVSYEYASRYQILPVAANDTQVVFATAEPWLSEWVEVLHHTLRRDIARVVANPLDISRYQLEFYGVSRSILFVNQHQKNDVLANLLLF